MTHRKHRPTHIEMLCTVLGHAPGHTLTRDALYQELCSRYTPWSRTDFDTRLERALADDRCPVHAVRGAGNKVRWTGGTALVRGGAGDRFSVISVAPTSLPHDRLTPSHRVGDRHSDLPTRSSVVLLRPALKYPLIRRNAPAPRLRQATKMPRASTTETPSELDVT